MFEFLFGCVCVLREATECYFLLAGSATYFRYGSGIVFFLVDSLNASVGDYVVLSWSCFVADLVGLLREFLPLPVPSLASVGQSIPVKLEDVN